MSAANSPSLLGAVAGDVIGSVYESTSFCVKTKNFAPLIHPRAEWTDDTVLTVAVADSILNGRGYGETLAEYGRRYPMAGYGGSFMRWFRKERPEPYGSCGNGSAMRVSPVGWAFDNKEDVMRHAKLSAEVTHDHPEGIKGAQATALAIFLARMGSSKEDIAGEIASTFHYDLSRTVDSIRPDYTFQVLCQESVPESIICFLESESVEDAIRNAISLGGDADTMGAIAGSIAQAYFRGNPEASLPADVVTGIRDIMPKALVEVMDEFCTRYQVMNDA